MRKALTLASLISLWSLLVQAQFPTDPHLAELITSDIPKFWEAFDQLENERNPFKEYLNKGSAGVRDFIPYRIESAKNLLKTVRKRKEDYEKIRTSSLQIASGKEEIIRCFQRFRNIYTEAVFPPTYFVIGAFNSGGTATENGVIIGAEIQADMQRIPGIVSHEMIHFNQHYNTDKNTLLSQSIREGAADFLGEMISGQQINIETMKYGDMYEEELIEEFLTIMDDTQYHGWLYGSKGKKKGRPNDLGYWIGYKICEAYYESAANKEQAVSAILNIHDFREFLTASGYLNDYL